MASTAASSNDLPVTDASSVEITELPEPQQAPEPHPDSAKLVADLAARVFSEEGDRTKSLDTKAGILLSATSASLVLGVGTMAKPAEVFTKIPAAAPEYGLLHILYFGATPMAVLLLGAALGCFFWSARTRTFGSIDL